jgi:type I restriction enzyme, S subunit
VSAYPLVALGAVLKQYDCYVDKPEPRAYKKLSVRLYGKGVVLDTPADGRHLRMQRHQIARAGQIIVSEIWGKKGAIGIVPEEGDGALCTSHFFLFDPDSTRIELGYLKLLLKANYLEPQLSKDAQGTTGYAAVRPRHLLAACIPLPPLSEQRRIVSRIDRLFPKLEEIQALRADALAERRALGSALADQEYQRLSDRNGLRTLASVCVSITDGDHNTPVFVDDGVPFISVGNVSSGTLHFSGARRVSSEYFAALKPQRVPVRGDVLYSAVGATLGIPALVECDLSFCFQRHVAILKPDRCQLDGRFLWHMLRARRVFAYTWAATTGSAQPTVPLHALRGLRIPVPSLDEQRASVARLDSALERLRVVERIDNDSSPEFGALLPSILDRAFAGAL